MSALHYRNMCWDILKNKQWYKPIQKELVNPFNQEFNEVIFQAYTEGIIIKDTYEGIQVPHPRIPTFYALPKMHKNITNPPGRPIISGIGSQIECASKLVD